LSKEPDSEGINVKFTTITTDVENDGVVVVVETEKDLKRAAE
jgi:hypothetical protein